jgi:hypothetical protein
MKKITFLLALFSICATIFAENIDINTAQKAGKNFYYERVNQVADVQYNKIALSHVYTAKNEQLENIYYAFNVNDNKGFVIVSADDIANPVIGYSFTGEFMLDNQPDAFKMHMENFSNEIEFARKNHVKSHPETAEKWQYLLDYKPSKGVKDILTVEAFILTHWNQSGYYNEWCPEDSEASDGRVPVGCVAVAMAQAMKYYDFPETGSGSNSYNYWWGWDYGTLSANFGATTYHWDEMPFSLASANDPVAQLLYHCGVAIEMYYGPDGSGADVGTTADKLVENFDYSNSIDHVHRDSYSETNWNNLMKNELDNYRPIIYSGSPESGAGHAWNVDGYQGDDHFHMNWGWGGSMDGYYYLDNIVMYVTSGGEPLELNYYQDAIIQIYPSGSYPDYCGGTTIVDGYVGNITDGSGSELYQNNKNCSWLFQPTCGSFTTISFEYFDIDVNDAVYIYDGTSTSDDLLAVYYGGDYTSTVTSSGNGLLVNFITDGSVTGTGWAINYETQYCTSDLTYTDETGTLTDGSGTCDYQPASYCKWFIQPPYATQITLDFNSFDLFNDMDYLKVYQNTISELVVKYDAENPPTAPLSIDAPIVILKFFSNTDGEASGWSLDYNCIINSDTEIDPFAEYSVYPNPFNADATISYSLNSNADVNISISNILGEQLGTYNAKETAGAKSIMISDMLDEVYSGIYFVTLQIDNKQVTKKVICQ